MFHSNISSNSVSTNGNGSLNTIELTEFRNKINSLLDELKALPNHEEGSATAVNSFTKIVQSTEVTDKHSSTLLLNHLTDTVKAFTVIPNTDMSTEGGATASLTGQRDIAFRTSSSALSTYRQRLPSFSRVLRSKLFAMS